MAKRRLYYDPDLDAAYWFNSPNWEEFETGGPGGSPDWGDIGGTLADQTDLQTALNAKSATSHNHDASYSALGHTHAAIAAWPIGSVFIAVVSTNPNTLLGGGTWAAFGTGRVLVGIDSGDSDFNTVEETGGAKTVTLSSAEMPSHTHTQDSHNHTQDSHNHTQDAHTHTQNAHTHTQNSHNHTQDSHNHTQDAHTHSVLSQTSASGGAQSYEHGTLDTSSTAAANANPGTGSTTATNQAQTATNQAQTAVNQDATAINQNATATNQAQTATNQAAIATNQNTGGGGAHSNVQPYIVVYMWKRTA